MSVTEISRMGGSPEAAPMGDIHSARPAAPLLAPAPGPAPEKLEGTRKTADTPGLPLPRGEALAGLANWPALPTPGMALLSAIIKNSSEQRLWNRQNLIAQTDALAASMKEQAGQMRSLAGAQLALGVVAGTVGVAQGLGSLCMLAGVGGKGLDAQTMAARAQGFSAAMGGGAGVVQGVNQGVGTFFQAGFKEKESDQERLRSLRESLRGHDESLQELVRRSLESMGNVQSQMNQARSRILG